MHRQQKLLDILLGLLITDVEDAAVRPEHRDDGLDRNPNNYNFKELLVERFVAEGQNCGIKVTVADLDHFLKEVYRVADHVRK
jgi:hypothetical protein